jgi:hypothetical protein
MEDGDDLHRIILHLIHNPVRLPHNFPEFWIGDLGNNATRLRERLNLLYGLNQLLDNRLCVRSESRAMKSRMASKSATASNVHRIAVTDQV